MAERIGARPGRLILSDFVEAEAQQRRKTEINLQKLNEDLPTMRDEWACSTTAVAFLVRQATGRKILPVEIDNAVGREPGAAGNAPKLALWLLEKGFSLENYSKPDHPFSAHAISYAYGEITFDNLFALYQEYFGAVDERNRAVYKAYYDDVFTPSVLHGEELMKPYRENGQIVSHEDVDITIPQMTEALQSGGYIFCAIQTKNASHAVCIFRPDVDETLPLMMFEPRTDRSIVKPFPKELIDKIDRAYGVWRPPLAHAADS